MSEKRFVYGRTMPLNSVEDLLPCITDKETENVYVRMSDIVNLLNELNDENEQLRQTIKEMQNDERLYANEIVKLNKEAKEVLDFKTLGGDY